MSDVLICVRALLTFALFSTSVLGQEPPSNEQTVIEEVTVTARQREEKAVKVPMSVTVFSATDIKKAGIKTVEDFSALTPNVTFSQSQNPGNITFSVRGISQVRNGDSPFAVVVDGAAVSSPNAINTNLYDIERIEVLKGPQGALYGRNAIGGVISVTTTKPTNTPTARVTTGYGKSDALFTAASVGGAITDSFYFRAGAQVQDRDGLIDNQTLDAKADPHRDEDYQFAFSYYPTENWEIGLKGTSSETRNGGAYFIPEFHGNANETSTLPVSDQKLFAEREVLDGTLSVQYSRDWGTLAYLVSQSDLEELVYADDYTQLSILLAYQDLEHEAGVQELRYTSPDDQRLRWIVGMFYQDVDRLLDTVVDIDFDNNRVFDFRITRSEANDNKTKAFFAQANYALTEKAELSIALRDDKDQRNQTNLADHSQREKTFSKVQPRFSFSWSAAEDRMYYLTYAEGFRSGGFNAPNIDFFPEVYEKETTEAFELGYKAFYLNRRLQVNSAVFHTDFFNQQYYAFDGTQGAQGILFIPESVAKGYELESQAILNYGFQVGLAYGYTDSEIVRLPSESAAYEGNQSPNVDKHTLNLTLEHQLPLQTDRRLVSRVDFRQQGRRYWHIDNVDYRKPIDLINAKVTYEMKNWRFGVWAKNLTDTGYNTEFIAQEYSGLTYDLRFPAQPRSFGVEAQWNLK